MTLLLEKLLDQWDFLNPIYHDLTCAQVQEVSLTEALLNMESVVCFSG